MRKNSRPFLSLSLSVLALILTLAVPALALEDEPNLISYWKLNGDANDDAGGNHGTLIGDPSRVNDPNRGWCLSFDGDGDYVDVGDDPSLTFTQEITLACWIKVRMFDRNWNAVVTKGDDWVLARTRDDNRVAFLCLGLTGGEWPEVYSENVNDGSWHITSPACTMARNSICIRMAVTSIQNPFGAL